MRTKAAVLVSALLILGLVLPSASWARREVVIGSLSLAKSGGVALTTELVGVAIFANPGWEKIITQQIPPFTLPIVLDAEKEDDDQGQAGSRRFRVNTDTTLLLTNTTDSSLALVLTVRDSAGVVLHTETVTLGAHATQVIQLSSFLP